MPKKKKLSSEELGNNFYKAGWMPGYEIDNVTGLGEITHVGNDPNYQSKYDDILKEWGFDPNLYEIDGQVRASSWNTQLKKSTYKEVRQGWRHSIHVLYE